MRKLLVVRRAGEGKLKAKLTPEQLAAKAAARKQKKEKAYHEKLVRGIFAELGFAEDVSLREKEITYNKRTSDLDGVFLFENLVVICELTGRKNNVSEHLAKKAHLYKEAVEDPAGFVEFLKTHTAKGSALAKSTVHKSKYKVVALYAPQQGRVEDHAEKYPYIVFASIEHLVYFRDVIRSVRRSARNEFLSFLGVAYSDLISSTSTSQAYAGTVLPEAHSNFADGYKVVSFYATPEWLLSQAYVLRKDGWRTDDGLYQRMILKTKINRVRQYLLDGGNVFVNNIIVSLPAETTASVNGKTIEFKKIASTTPATITIPASFSSVGLIDGQHRVFAYHEGGAKDDVMNEKRAMQNILVTGIVRPPDIEESAARQFESKLFLEINATQTKANAELTQAIEVIVKPFTETSLSRRIVNRLNGSGPLAHVFETGYASKEKLKVASVVNYGVRPLIRFAGNDTLFAHWAKSTKSKLVTSPSNKLADEYVSYCTDAIRSVFIEFKKRIPAQRWVAKRTVAGHVLSTVVVNGVMVFIRKIIEQNPKYDFAKFDGKLKGIENFDLSPYKSSHYGALGEALFKKFG